METSSYSLAICLLIVHAILLIELINTSACLSSLLLAGVERMAFGTDFYVDILLCRTCNESISTVACYSCLIIVRMDSFSHDFTSSYYIKSHYDFS